MDSARERLWQSFEEAYDDDAYRPSSEALFRCLTSQAPRAAIGSAMNPDVAFDETDEKEPDLIDDVGLIGRGSDIASLCLLAIAAATCCSSFEGPMIFETRLCKSSKETDDTSVRRNAAQVMTPPV